MLVKWKNPPIATSEKDIVAGVDKAVGTPEMDEQQLKLGIDDHGKLIVKTPI